MTDVVKETNCDSTTVTSSISHHLTGKYGTHIARIRSGATTQVGPP